ncbi:alpha-L-fucosidase [Leadbetterella sp. DM7]|uniref:alpha-L-fucosidase n=1 Tax=Leadbetterella sp. DM7 TaxID=3235085 RepID=UPI00349EF29D
MRKIVLTFILGLSLSAQAQYAPNWESLNKRETPAWFEDAKFGIFIHWGVYSVPAWATLSNADGFGSYYSEWYWQRLNNKDLKIHKEFVDFHQKVYAGKPYQDFANDFKAELFDPDRWAGILKESGARYVVLTSKHHEGFAMWPSKQSWNWNAGDIGPRRDLLGDLTRSVKAKGLKMGYYYSLYEWYNPMYNTDLDRYIDERMLPQMKDLVETYQPDILWGDGEWDHPTDQWRVAPFMSWLFNESKVKDSIVINDRWGSDTRSKYGSFYTTEYADVSQVKFNRPWEECRGIGESFGYSRNENLEMYSSAEKLVHMLVEIVSKGGNLLLNIGPRADGGIPVIMQERLAEIGAWLKVNGEAIYGTRAVPDAPKGDKIFFTGKNNTVYLITTEWKDVVQAGLPAKPKKVSMLGVDTPLKYTSKGGVLTITAPQLSPKTNPCNYAWVYKLEY